MSFGDQLRNGTLPIADILGRLQAVASKYPNATVGLTKSCLVEILAEGNLKFLDEFKPAETATTDAPGDFYDQLVVALTKAREAGEAVTNLEDGGTCNLDSPAFRAPRKPAKKLVEAAEEAGVTITPFSWFGGKKWYWVGGFSRGQGNLRARICTAAYKALKEHAPEGLEVCAYLQMD